MGLIRNLSMICGYGELWCRYRRIAEWVDSRSFPPRSSPLPDLVPGYVFRLLRSVKNRFGPSNEIGVFQMTSLGLEDVADPSMLFLSTRHVDEAGDEVSGNVRICPRGGGGRRECRITGKEWERPHSPV